MTLSIELVLQIGGVLLSIGVAWGLLKGKMDKLSEKIDTSAAEALRTALDANRSAHRSHVRLDDHSGRLTKVETGSAFHERRLDENMGLLRSEIAGFHVALERHVSAMDKRFDMLDEKIDRIRS